MSVPGDDAEVLYAEAPCGLLLTAADGTILRANTTLCRWLGFNLEELVAKRFPELLTVGCRIFHQTHWMPLLQMQGSVAEVQLDVLHREGHALPMLVNAIAPQSLPGTHHISLFVATDRRKYERELLLARRQAEQLLDREKQAQAALSQTEAELRMALDAASLRVWRVDPANKKVRYGAGVGSLIGRPDLDPVDADTYFACAHPDDVPAAQAAFDAALDPAVRAAYAVEYRLRGHDGVERTVSSRGRASFSQSGQLLGFSGVLQDVTEMRQAERLLEERATLAEQLVGIVSHDLRSPLHAITLGAHLMSTSELTPAQARATARISAAASRATRLTGDLLDFTQASLGGGLRVTPREIDVQELLAECVEELKLAWPGRMIEHRAQGLSTATCDPDRLAQVVTNLTNNALTYGSADEPVTLTSHVTDQALELRVHNSGRPIPPALVPHVFEPLRRGEQQVKQGSRSVGLGLYIVREIALAHGGRVSVESSESSGTTFTVTIPQASRTRA